MAAGKNRRRHRRRGGAAGVFAAVLTRAGKKVVLLEQGPDWKPTDLISSESGSRLKRSVRDLYAGKDAVGCSCERLGHRRRGDALFRHVPAPAAERFQHEKRLRPRARLAVLLRRSRPLLRSRRPRHRRVRRRQGGRALAPARPALSDAAAEELPLWRGLADGLRGGRPPHDPRAVGINSTPTRAGRPASMTAGAMPAARPGRSPIRNRPGSARRATRARRCGPISYVTRVLTNPAGDPRHRRRYYDDQRK